MDEHVTEPTTEAAVEAFIREWRAAQASERANGQAFVIGLTELVGAATPGVATGDVRRDAYVFERPVRFHDGPKESVGFADLYKRGAVVLETKQGVDAERAAQGKRQRKGHGVRGTGAWEATMEAAKNQAARYARNLEPAEPVPPFLAVVDVGHCVDLYADFGGTGRLYAPFPSAETYRVHLDDLRDPAVRERLRLVFEDPYALDPARRQAAVTQELAGRLATIAASLDADAPDDEERGEQTAGFLTRCLFCMFAEDAGLLPDRAFSQLLEAYRDRLDVLPSALSSFFRAMDEGGFVMGVDVTVPEFDGVLFRDRWAPELDRDQLDGLLAAAAMDWREVEPAIFGTLVERALDPKKRRHMGAHFTPRAYVERVIGPAVIEPLREEWEGVRAAARAAEAEAEEEASPKAAQKKRAEARDLISGFLGRLARVRVLDPACGSGNFLYVTFAGLKALESEVRAALRRFGQTESLELEGVAVTPHQMLGIELGARAAAVADLVLWIGYLQWHVRTHGGAQPLPEPILKGYGQVEHRDALLDVDGDRAAWPEADFIVGNPPFVGKGQPMRESLGQEALDRLAAAYPEVPGSVDLVMYWWARSAEAVRARRVRRFGLITTSSITQTFNRRIVERHLDAEEDPLALSFAIPNHPWVDEGADVRMAVTVGVRASVFDAGAGRLATVASETPTNDGVPDVELTETVGEIHADLTVGADVTQAEALEANEGLASFGMMLAGRGFLISPKEARAFGLGSVEGADRVLRPTLNGRDLAKPARERYVIDLYGYEADEARERFPEVYEHVVREVKPQRDGNRDKQRRERWWLHGRTNENLRTALAGLHRFIATPETAKHRVFSFLDVEILPEHKLVAVALEDAYHLGMLSSRVHGTWAVAAGGKLGVGNDPVYNKGKCFETFPFPAPTEAQEAEIRRLGDAIDVHRKARQAAHPGLGLTDLYNAVEALRAGRDLDKAEERAADAGLAHTLLDLHRQLDRAVLEAYGWSDLDAEAKTFEGALLDRLVALNAERHEEERQGVVRYLRPAFQDPDQTSQAGLALPTAAAQTPEAVEPRPWPSGMAAQTVAVRQAVAALGSADAAGVAARFRGAGPKTVAPVLETLAELGLGRAEDGGFVA
ncbi:MAG: SAM-dependent methyltransferase [Rhodothermaceae bacterium]|nr:SAM-dependent methyltransferase [Rhodothermaceae bacterium]